MRSVLNRKHCKEWAIVTFCLWHMTAIALFVLPGDVLSDPVVARAKAITTPYVYSLTQWQYWNIFAPDPLQRSSTYRIDLLAEDGTWFPVHVIDYVSLPWNARAKEFKILENLEENWQGIVPSYLQTFCRTLSIPNGNRIRLMAVSFVLPAELEPLKHAAALELPMTERELGSTICNAP